MKRSIPKAVWHLLIWVAYVTLSILVHVGHDLWGTVYEAIVSNMISALIFYVNALWVLPRFYETGKYFKFGVAEVGLWAGSVLLRYLFAFVIDPYLFHVTPSTAGTSSYYIVLVFTWQWFGFLVYSTSYWFARMDKRNRLRLKDLEIEKMKQQNLELENTALKAQINPHFLFNTLDSFRQQIEALSPGLGRDMNALMSIMESSVVKTGSDGMIALSRELETVEGLISIYRRRYPDINISYSRSVPAHSDYRILPHVLMCFVENAFEHGAYYDPVKSIVIQVKIDKGDLIFAVYNKKGVRNKERSAGIGIPLIKRHLNNGYKERHTLLINDDEEDFYVFLRINAIDRVKAKTARRQASTA